MTRPGDDQPAPADLTTTIRHDRDGDVLIVSGEVDAFTAPRLRSDLERSVATRPARSSSIWPQ